MDRYPSRIVCFTEENTETLHLLGKDRILADPTEVIRRAPDIYIASGCGEKLRAEQVRAGEGGNAIPAVRNDELHEIKPPLSCSLVRRR